MILLHRQSGIRSIDTDLEQEGDGKHRKKILYSSTICLLVGTEEKINQINPVIIRCQYHFGYKADLEVKRARRDRNVVACT